MTPLEYYNEQCKQGVIVADHEQQLALKKLETVLTALVAEQKKRKAWYRVIYQPKPIAGLYLWGGVGIGKTYLMDCFYFCLPFKQKLRMHFHSFMRHIHQELSHHQGEADPIKVIAKELAKKIIVLCFDEFYVSDITDAMILGRLLKALFMYGVTLVATSNIAPDDLYKNGLQRSQFLPAIALIKKNLAIVHIPTTVDYRLRHLQAAGVFYTPLNEKARENMQKTFELLTKGHSVDESSITINGRQIPVIKKTSEIVWFDFAVICRVPRSQNDYLAIAEKYHTVFISDIPIIPTDATDTICLFVSLVDVFYDAKVKLVMSAAESIPEIYSRGFMILEYTRTHSRLLEMQSMDYFIGEEKI